jgi:DNA-binding transcriptional regulator YdaS (Cro superfamily)
MHASHPLESWLANAPVKRGEFAKSVGCSPSHLTLVTQGKRGVSLELALSIERETGGAVTTKQLLEARRAHEEQAEAS